MILIAFDGSEDSRAAVARAGEPFTGQSVTVLTVWERFIDRLVRTSFGRMSVVESVDIEKIDVATERRAKTIAAAGAELARQAGLEATPLTCVRHTTVDETILDAAENVSAEAIVVGSRGLTGVKSLLLGSVSHAVLQHADLTVIVVPSGEVAARRKRSRRRLASAG